MSAQRSSAELLSELKRLSEMEPGAQRSALVWQTFGQTYGAEDCAVLADFATEYGLLRQCGDGLLAPKYGTQQSQRVWINPVDGAEMVWIPGGPFFVGPKKAKCMAESEGFALARHPVTNQQFAKFLRESRYEPPADHPDAESFLANWRDGEIPTGLETHPVVWVSYLDALAYCDWAGVTLPTEWLWEKAARGPDGPPFPWGEHSPVPGYRQSALLANVRGGGTVPVGSFACVRSAYGCEDMIGNISEWCRMIDGEDYGRIPRDRPDTRVPSSAETVYTAVRGSCFLRSGESRMAAWHQRRLSVTRRNRWVGFRPACFLPCYPA